MHAFVTGATGFIGRSLVQHLLLAGWEVTCMTRSDVQPVVPNLVTVQGDLLDSESIKYQRKIHAPIDVFFHLAARLPGKAEKSGQLQSYLKANAIGTAALLEIFRCSNAQAFVYMSSLPVIGKPKDLPVTEKHTVCPKHPYLISKFTAELLCEQYRKNKNLPITILRLTSPYGIGMAETSVLPLFIKCALSSQNISLYGSGKRCQNFIHISDIVRACLLAASGKKVGIFNIGGEQSVSMKKLAQIITEAIPHYNGNILFSPEKDPEEDYQWEISLEKSKIKLGYLPNISLKEGIREYITCLLNQKAPYKWWVEI